MPKVPLGDFVNGSIAASTVDVFRLPESHITHMDNSRVRNIFTTAFIFLNISIAYIGESYIKHRNQSILQRRGNEALPINHLSPWLSPWDTIIYTCKTRRLPGGAWALLMLLTGLIGLAHQYFVNQYITLVSLPGTCPFIGGVFIDLDSSTVRPLSGGPAAKLIKAAQGIALQNWCSEWRPVHCGPEDGGNIWRTVSNDSSFLPQDQDVLGTWNCRPLNSTLYPADQNDSNQVIEDLTNNWLGGGDNFSQMGDISTDEPRANGLLIWNFLTHNASALDSTPESCDVKTAISRNFSLRSIGRDWPSQQVTMLGYCCQLSNANNFSDVTTIWSSIDKDETADEFVEVLYNDLIQTNPENYSVILENTLSAMIMLAGGDNGATHLFPDLYTYGCISHKTAINMTIFIILGALILIFVPLFCFNMLEYYRTYNSEEVPSDLLSWQVWSLRHGLDDPTVEEKSLHKFSYGWSKEKCEPAFIENSRHRKSQTSPTPANPETNPPAPSMSFQSRYYDPESLAQVSSRDSVSMELRDYDESESLTPRPRPVSSFTSRQGHDYESIDLEPLSGSAGLAALNENERERNNALAKSPAMISAAADIEGNDGAVSVRESRLGANAEESEGLIKKPGGGTESLSYEGRQLL